MRFHLLPLRAQTNNMTKKERKEQSRKALKSPSFDNLKFLNDKDGRQLAQSIRNQIIDAVSHNGGHLSSNLGSVELTISLLKAFDAKVDDIIFDTGHQAYAYKILTGRDIDKIRLDDGVSPFMDRMESEFDKVSTGHCSSSLSLAYGLEVAKRNDNKESYTIVVIGDGAMESGIAYEALNNIGADKLSRMIIIYNDNGMSIQQARGALAKWSTKVRTSSFYGKTAEHFYSLFATHKATRWIYYCLKKIKDFFKRSLLGMNIFENLGFSYIGPVDGNNLKKVDSALNRAKFNKHGPIIVHLLTRKGLGYTPAELDKEGSYHGVSPLKVNGKESLMNQKNDDLSFSKSIQTSLAKVIEEDEKTVLIDPAMVVGSNLADVFKQYPSRCYDVGIAEEHAMAFAGGISLKGGHPIVIEYSTFLQRAFDEMIEDVSRQRTPVLCIVDKCGLAGGDGESHHGIYDVCLGMAIPNTRIYMPYASRQVEEFLDSYDFTTPCLTMLRVPRGDGVNISSQFERNALEGLILADKKNSDKLYLGVGPLGYKLLENLDKKIDCGMVTDLLINFDIDQLLGYKKIFFYDVYGVETGTCNILKAKLLDKGFKGEFISYCLKGKFYTFGSNETILSKEGLDIESVENDILRLI